MPPRKASDWKTIANNFNLKANFPNCIGAIDGKHIRMIRPCDSGSLYFNYKKYFSINILAVCKSNYEYIYVNVGSLEKVLTHQFSVIAVFTTKYKKKC